MKHDIAPYRRWDPKPMWLSAWFHPPEVGQYRVRKFSQSELKIVEMDAYYFGGVNKTWRVLKIENGVRRNIGPLSIDGLEYLAAPLT